MTLTIDWKDILGRRRRRCIVTFVKNTFCVTKGFVILLQHI